MNATAAKPQAVTPPVERTLTRPARVLSIDVLRGLTIALMILVNDPGDWSHTYRQLDHAQWNGFTLTDFVFPNFLFLVGFSVILSLDSRLARGESRGTLALHIFRRAFTIFAVKLFLSAYPHFHLTHLRIFGVLTRIAVCYLVVGLICLYTRSAGALAAITASLLIGYWVLMRFAAVPGYGIPTHAIPMMDPDHNLAAVLDRAFNSFTQHYLHTGSLYNRTRDPEGLLSTIPAIATTLIGSLTALFLRRTTSLVGRHSGARICAPESPCFASTGPDGVGRPVSRYAIDTGVPALGLITVPSALVGAGGIVLMLIITGLLFLAGGLLWNPFFPINKNLWTSSYVLYSAGWSLLTLAVCYWLIDVRRCNEYPWGKILLWPWLVFGSNAITAYVVSNLLVETLIAIHLYNPANPAHPTNAWAWPYAHIFAAHGSTDNTSLAFAIAVVAICFIPNWILWHRKIFLKI